MTGSSSSLLGAGLVRGGGIKWQRQASERDWVAATGRGEHNSREELGS
uniref:Uncharacterized protein n=1 Tax=Arundo donax TaxID=35708 RepID=A0A0A9AT33_ARUDO